MGDHDEGSGPGVEQILGGREHVDVHIVGGLVEHEHIGLVEKGQHQLEAAPLTAGEITHPCRQLVAAKAEALQQLCRGELPAVHLVSGLQAPHHLAHQVVGQFRQPAGLLVQHRQPHRLAALDPAAVGGDAAGDEAQQGGLPRAVGTDDPGALTGCDTPFHIPQNGFPAVGHRDVQQVDDILAQSRGRQLGEFDGVANRRDVGDQLVGRVDTELGLGGAGRRATAQPGQLLAHQVLPLGLGRGRDPVPLHSLQHIGRVAAVERFDDTPFSGGVDLPGGGRDLVEKPAVVGHQQQPAGVA